MVVGELLFRDSSDAGKPLTHLCLIKFMHCGYKGLSVFIQTSNGVGISFYGGCVISLDLGSKKGKRFKSPGFGVFMYEAGVWH